MFTFLMLPIWPQRIRGGTSPPTHTRPQPVPRPCQCDDFLRQLRVVPFTYAVSELSPTDRVSEIGFCCAKRLTLLAAEPWAPGFPSSFSCRFRPMLAGNFGREGDARKFGILYGFQSLFSFALFCRVFISSGGCKDGAVTGFKPRTPLLPCALNPLFFLPCRRDPLPLRCFQDRGPYDTGISP